MNKICRLCSIQFPLLLCLILIFCTAVPVKADQTEELQQSSERSETTEFTCSMGDNDLKSVDYEPLRSEEFSVDPEEDLYPDTRFLSDLKDPVPGMDSNEKADYLQSGNMTSLSSNPGQLDNPTPFFSEQQPLISPLAESSPTMQKIDDYWIIETFADLNDVRIALNDKYRLANDIEIPENTNWDPIGFYLYSPFTGLFDGSGFTVSGLIINKDLSHAGLFGYIENATIIDLHLRDVSINNGSKSYVGGLVGRADKSTINRCSVEGSITSSGNNLGGLVGYLQESFVEDSYANCTVVGTKTAISIGGLVGYAGEKNRIKNSYSAGIVSGSSYVGGLVGYLGGDKNNSNNFSRVNDSYSVVKFRSNGIRHGGLVGDSHSTAQCINSYWDVDISGQLTSTLGTGKTTSNMKSQESFTYWDFVDTWFIEEGISYPILRWQLDDSSSNPDDPDDSGSNPGEEEDDGTGGQDDNDDDLPGDNSNEYPTDLSIVGNLDFLMLFDQPAGFYTGELLFKLLSMIRQIEKLISLIKEAGDDRQAAILIEIDLLFAETKELFEANRYRLSPAEGKFILEQLESITTALAAY